jgi:short chain dehydrogenase
MEYIIYHFKLESFQFSSLINLKIGGNLKKGLKLWLSIHIIYLKIFFNCTKSKFCPAGLWGVVNNAGLSTFGHIEWIGENDSRKVMDVNAWGIVKVTRAFMPLIRQASGNSPINL